MDGSKINTILTIEYICNEKENQFFDRKSAKKPVKEIANHIAGFANSNGGTLVIGISDDGKIEGFEDFPEKYNKFLKSTSTDYLKVLPRVENETIEVVNYKGNKDKILFIHVYPSINFLVKNVKDEIYFRQGDSTNKINSEQSKIIEVDRREHTFEEQLNTRSTITDIDLDMVEIYKKSINATEKDSLDLLRAKQFLIKNDINGKENLTNAGVLLFAKNPSLFFPSARVRIVKFEGTQMQTGANLNIVKDKTFELPLYKVIKESQNFLDTQLREFTHLGLDGEFVTVPEYPKFAWEEGITNAVTHRNYRISGEHTKILIYDDRMEILNPGDLPGIVNIKNIKEKRYARNPIISRVLTELGLVKELNEGVSRIYREMEELFLDDPEYVVEEGVSVKLVLRNNIIMRDRRKNENLLKDSNINEKWFTLNLMEQKTLQMIFDKGEVTTSQIADFINRDKRTAQRILKKLEDKSLVEWVGTSTRDPKKTYIAKYKVD
jgi:ATP-dependent DNA helicase RecG